MAFKTLDVEDLYNEISDLARDQGVRSKVEWDELVEEVIEDHLDVGEIDLEQDTESMKEALREQWANYKEEAEVKGDEDEPMEKDSEENDESTVGIDDEEDEEDDDDDDYGDGSEER